MDQLIGRISFVLHAVTLFFALLEYIRTRKINIAFYFFVTALAANILALIIRGLTIGHLPFSGRFEAIVLYTCMTSLVVLFLIIRFRFKLLILYITPLLLMLLTVALTKPQRASGDLALALKTPLFGIHVVLVFLGYAFYTTNFCLAVFTNTSQDKILGMIDRSVYLGALFLGAGIAAGAFWAHLSWGSWWGWDPKETWALITLLLYVLYLHTRAVYRPGRWSVAVFLVAGYASLVMTFLGISLLNWTVHSY